MNPSLNTQGQPRWYLLQTRPQQEALVLAALQRQQINCVLPLLQGDGVAPLFPRYVFVQLGNTDGDVTMVWHTPGVTGLLKRNDEFAPVPESIIAAFNNCTAAPSGGYSTLSGVHEIACGLERSLELIQLICRPRPAAGPLRRAA